jgi:hypothetical protein
MKNARRWGILPFQVEMCWGQIWEERKYERKYERDISKK